MEGVWADSLSWISSAIALEAEKRREEWGEESLGGVKWRERGRKSLREEEEEEDEGGRETLEKEREMEGERENGGSEEGTEEEEEEEEETAERINIVSKKKRNERY